MGVQRLLAERDPMRLLRERGLDPYYWSAAPGATFSPHRHGRTKRLYVVSGSISFDGLELGPGDGILIPAGTEHSARCGTAGVTCIEAFEWAETGFVEPN